MKVITTLFQVLSNFSGTSTLLWLLVSGKSGTNGAAVASPKEKIWKPDQAWSRDHGSQGWVSVGPELSCWISLVTSWCTLGREHKAFHFQHWNWNDALLAFSLCSLCSCLYSFVNMVYNRRLEYSLLSIFGITGIKKNISRYSSVFQIPIPYPILVQYAMIQHDRNLA